MFFHLLNFRHLISFLNFSWCQLFIISGCQLFIILEQVYLRVIFCSRCPHKLVLIFGFFRRIFLIEKLTVLKITLNRAIWFQIVILRGILKLVLEKLRFPCDGSFPRGFKIFVREINLSARILLSWPNLVISKWFLTVNKLMILRVFIWVKVRQLVR